MKWIGGAIPENILNYLENLKYENRNNFEVYWSLGMLLQYLRIK